MQITNHHAQGFMVGYVAGIAVSIAIALSDLKRAQKQSLLALDFSKRLVEDAWVYLPTEVKMKHQTDVKFFNIAIEEF